MPFFSTLNTYKELTGDQSGSSTSNEKKLTSIFEKLEDPGIIADLHHNNAEK